MLRLIVGDYKTGKTVSACTFPKPMIYFDYDDGFKSAKYAKDKSGKNIVSDLDGITVIPMFKKGAYDLSFTLEMGKSTAPKHTIHSVDLVNQYNTLTKSLLEKGTITIDGKEIGPFKTLVIDSLTTMFRNWKEALLKVNNISSLRIPDYGTLEGVLLGQFIPTLKSLNIDNILLIDHVEVDKDELTGMITEYPIGPSKNMGRNLGKEIDEIYRQKVEGDKYVWRTRKTGFFQAGSRLHLPDPIEAKYEEVKKYE